jgi:hypothetical protein
MLLQVQGTAVHLLGCVQEAIQPQGASVRLGAAEWEVVAWPRQFCQGAGRCC